MCPGRVGRWVTANLGDDTRLLELSFEQLLEWQEQRSCEISPAGRRGELSNVREFFRWAQREGLRSDDPTLRIPMPRAPRRLPRPMSEVDFEQALRSADARISAVLGLAGYAGLRSMEIAQLDWSEVSLTDDPPIVRVVDGKGGVGRSVPAGPALVALLRALPDRRGPVIRRGDGNRGHCATWNISHLANGHLRDCEVDATLHQLRHRFATAAYGADNDLRAVQDLLGHASPNTTAMYASPSRGATVRAVTAASVVESGSGIIRREVLLESTTVTARLRWRMANDGSTSERRIELEIRQAEGPSSLVRLPATRAHLVDLAASVTQLADKLGAGGPATPVLGADR